MVFVGGFASTNVDNDTLEVNGSGDLQVKDGGIDTDQLADNSITAAKLASDALNSLVPIGAVLPWLKSLTGVPSLPSNFVECDGSTISDVDSPLNGQTVPDLNGNQQFLRGASTSGSSGGATTHTHSIPNFASPQLGGPGSVYTMLGSTNTGSGSSLPSYYGAVMIMRIK